VPLFIDRLPFSSWTNQTATPPVTQWSVVLPIIVTEVGVATPFSGAPSLDWALDTGFHGEAFAWRKHLITVGLDPDVNRAPGLITLTSTLAIRQVVPIRLAELWLASNIPGSVAPAWPLPLRRGIAFRDVPTSPDPNLNRPLLGMRVLRRAGLRVELDFANDTVSVWTP